MSKIKRFSQGKYESLYNLKVKHIECEPTVFDCEILNNHKTNNTTDAFRMSETLEDIFDSSCLTFQDEENITYEDDSHLTIKNSKK